MILTTFLESNAQKIPTLPALTMKMGFRTVSLTYHDVYIYAQKTALFLEKNNLHKGDVLLLCAPNSPFLVCLFWGCLLRGVVLVPLNIQSTPTMVQKIAEQTNARLLFSSLHSKQNFGTIPTYALEILPELISEFNLSDFKSIPLVAHDVVEIMYTSGTTGDPKGVVLTHENLYTNVQEVAQVIPLAPTEDRVLSVLPLSHIYEQTIGFLLPFKCGAHIIYAHSYAAIRDLLKQYCITKFLAVPEFLKAFMSKIEAQVEQQGKKKWFTRLLKLSQAIGNKSISRLIFRPIITSFGGCLDTIACGGAALDPLLERRWKALGITVLQGYGLTETSPVISSNSFKASRQGSVGKVIPGVQVKIDRDGEILVKGPSVFCGYFKNEEKTREAFTADEWFKTGDMGLLDADGFLFLKGRKKYMIKGSGAQNVFPEDIEAVLNKILEVKDSCVIGLEKTGGIVDIHAVLLLEAASNNAHLEKIIEQANTQLASYQQINSWSVWPEQDFPRSATRKVKKNEVSAYVSEQSKTKIQSTNNPTSYLVKLLSTLTHLQPEAIKQTTKLVQQLHLDSLLRIELVLRIEEECGVIIDETKITSQSTVADLEDMIKNPKSAPEEKKLKRWPRSWWAHYLRIISQSFFFAISKIFVKLEVVGVDNVKHLNLPVIFMPNHVSYFDSFALLRALPRSIRYRVTYAAAQDVLYEEYKHFALVAELLFNSFPFPRKEQENVKYGLDCMGKLLDEGYSVVMFPEGKMSETGTLLPLKLGAGLAGVEMGVAIVPVKLVGTEIIFPYNKMFPRARGRVKVIFGKPLHFSKTTSYGKATEEIEKALKDL
jgi:long-chain acyl-CoA synthetase